MARRGESRAGMEGSDHDARPQNSGGRDAARAPPDQFTPQSLSEKYQAASRLSIKRVIATYTNVSLVVGNSSSSLLNRRHWFNHAKVLSTTQRCGNTAKPFCPSARATDSRTILYCSLTQAVHSAPR